MTVLQSTYQLDSTAKVEEIYFTHPGEGNIFHTLRKELISTDKRAENVTHKGEFLMNFELNFGPLNPESSTLTMTRLSLFKLFRNI